MDRDDLQSDSPRTVLGIFAPAMEAPKRFLNFISTTPGILTIVSTMIVIAILAAGGAMTLSSTWRQEDLNTLITRTEPLSNASQELFNSLSVVDSAATTGFLEAKTSERASTEYFQEEVNAASRAVIQAASGIDQIDSREMELVLEIQTLLPRYMELVSEAKVNDRARNPVGAAYLTQASALMQDHILPAAEELYTSTSKQGGKKQRHVVAPMWFPISGLVAAVIILIIMQFWLAAKTNRTINIGYLASSVLMVIALLIAGISAGMTYSQGTKGVQSSMMPLERLTQQRISAQQARTGEALGLVQRNYGDDSQSLFSHKVSTIDTELESLRDLVSDPSRIDRARESLKDWDSAHATMVYQLQRSDFNKAIDSALGTDLYAEDDDADESGESGRTQGSGNPTRTDRAKGTDKSDSADRASSTRTSYTEFDRELQDMIKDARAQVQEALLSSRTAAEVTATAVLILTILAAGCSIAGIRPRLQEYL